MPFPSHIHTIQLISPLALPFGFLQEAGWMPFLGALRACITYVPLSKQFCLYIISTQFLLSPSLHHMVLKADSRSYSGSITSIRHSSWNILSAQRCFIEWMNPWMNEWSSMITPLLSDISFLWISYSPNSLSHTIWHLLTNGTWSCKLFHTYRSYFPNSVKVPLGMSRVFCCCCCFFYSLAHSKCSVNTCRLSWGQRKLGTRDLEK